MEANTFAIEVLAARSALQRFLTPPAELDHALALANAFEISREAAIRRYVALQGELLAVVFSQDNRVRYVEKSEGFPATRMWAGDSLAGIRPRRTSEKPLTTLDPVDPALWLKWPAGLALFAQTLHQDGGFAATLLVAERDNDLEVDNRLR